MYFENLLFMFLNVVLKIQIQIQIQILSSIVIKYV